MALGTTIFNNYFLSIADKITCDIRHKNSKGDKTYKSPTYYLAELFHKPFPSTQFNNTWTKEIEKIIKSLHLKNPLAVMRFPQKYYRSVQLSSALL